MVYNHLKKVYRRAAEVRGLPAKALWILPTGKRKCFSESHLKEVVTSDLNGRTFIRPRNPNELQLHTKPTGGTQSKKKLQPDC
jgi:hypothetical protein